MFCWELIEEDYYICNKGLSLPAFLLLLGDMTEAFCLVILESLPNFCFIMFLIFILSHCIILLFFPLYFFYPALNWSSFQGRFGAVVGPQALDPYFGASTTKVYDITKIFIDYYVIIL